MCPHRKAREPKRTEIAEIVLLFNKSGEVDPLQAEGMARQCQPAGPRSRAATEIRLSKTHAQTERTFQRANLKNASTTLISHFE
jgi:hypothetical protein